MAVPSLYSIALNRTVCSFKLGLSGLDPSSLLCRLTELRRGRRGDRIKIKGKYEHDALVDVLNKMECIVTENLISVPPKIMREIALRCKIWMVLSHLERALLRALLFSVRDKHNPIGLRLSQDEVGRIIDFQLCMIFLCLDGRCIFNPIPHRLFECLLNFDWTIEVIENSENMRYIECVVGRPVNFIFRHDDGYSNRGYREMLDFDGANLVKKSFRIYVGPCCPFH